jgi:hypothetical protein
MTNCWKNWWFVISPRQGEVSADQGSQKQLMQLYQTPKNALIDQKEEEHRNSNISDTCIGCASPPRPLIHCEYAVFRENFVDILTLTAAFTRLAMQLDLRNNFVTTVGAKALADETEWSKQCRDFDIRGKQDSRSASFRTGLGLTGYSSQSQREVQHTSGTSVLEAVV